MTSNLVSAARAVLGFMTYDKECICEKCNVLLALEAAVVADETTPDRRMEPQPLWEEAPSLDRGAWVGRYQCMRMNASGEGEADVDVDVHRAPADMANAEPIQINRVWYWRPVVKTTPDCGPSPQGKR